MLDGDLATKIQGAFLLHPSSSQQPRDRQPADARGLLHEVLLSLRLTGQAVEVGDLLFDEVIHDGGVVVRDAGAGAIRVEAEIEVASGPACARRRP